MSLLSYLEAAEQKLAAQFPTVPADLLAAGKNVLHQLGTVIAASAQTDGGDVRVILDAVFAWVQGSITLPLLLRPFESMLFAMLKTKIYEALTIGDPAPALAVAAAPAKA